MKIRGVFAPGAARISGRTATWTAVGEHLWPAVPRTNAYYAAVVEDSLWLDVEFAMRAAVLPLTAGLLATVWMTTTGGFTFEALAGVPGIARIGVSLLMWDLLEYWTHRIRHSVATLWHFHAIHHSIRNLNVLSSSHSHIGEYFIVQPLMWLPLFAFQLTPFELMGAGMAIGWFSRFSHSNLRCNLGPLGLLLVSPQRHRIHHSTHPAHRDKNFGLIFTVWDRLFGT